MRREVRGMRREGVGQAVPSSFIFPHQCGKYEKQISSWLIERKMGSCYIIKNQASKAWFL